MLVVNCLFILVLTIPIIILNNDCTGIRVHACVRGFGVVVVWWVGGGELAIRRESFGQAAKRATFCEGAAS